MQPEQKSDSDVIIRMLYYCTEPRHQTQIMSYCEIDAAQFKKYVQHCMKRNLVKIEVDEEGSDEYVVTEHGAEVLGTAAEIMGVLGIEKGELK